MGQHNPFGGSCGTTCKEDCCQFVNFNLLTCHIFGALLIEDIFTVPLFKGDLKLKVYLFIGIDSVVTFTVDKKVSHRGKIHQVLQLFIAQLVVKGDNYSPSIENS